MYVYVCVDQGRALDPIQLVVMRACELPIVAAQSSAPVLYESNEHFLATMSSL